MIRIENIQLKLGTDPNVLEKKIRNILGLKLSDSFSYTLHKKSIDARHKSNIQVIYNVNVSGIDEENILNRKLESKYRIHKVEPFSYSIQAKSTFKNQPVIVGTGPCGLFSGLVLAKAGLNPLFIERGKQVHDRISDVDIFFKSGQINPQSNVQFGEGGAGTFSDGKLYTLINNPRTQFIFQTLVDAGAPSEILYDAKPHIGTDNLRKLLPNLRQMIIDTGGEFRFESCLTDLNIENDQIQSIQINGTGQLTTGHLILAIGHSARDTYSLLYKKGLQLTPKVFAIGVRIEHLKKWIDHAQYGKSANHPDLPAGKYKLAAKLPDGRGAYTFCMCPGGYVVAAASEPDHLVTNGMSYYQQNGKNSNAALLINIYPQDLGDESPLSGIQFQRHWESLAFEQAEQNYFAPVQRVKDFLNDQPTSKIHSVEPAYQPGYYLSDLRKCLPPFVTEGIKTAIQAFGKKLHNFDHPDAILTGVETRSSSPVRISRDETCQSNIRGIYPAGEGAGYAGGIVSAALDGIKTAEAIINRL